MTMRVNRLMAIAGVAAAALSAEVLHAQGRGGPSWTTNQGDAQRSAWIRTDAKLSIEAMQKPGLSVSVEGHTGQSGQTTPQPDAARHAREHHFLQGLQSARVRRRQQRHGLFHRLRPEPDVLDSSSWRRTFGVRGDAFLSRSADHHHQADQRGAGGRPDGELRLAQRRPPGGEVAAEVAGALVEVEALETRPSPWEAAACCTCSTRRQVRTPCLP